MLVFKNHTLNEQFQRYGYVVVNLLDDAELRELTAIHVRHPAPSDIQSDVEASLLTADLGYRRSVHNEIKAVLDERIDELLLDYRIFHASFINKRPRTAASAMHLHQDAPFVDERDCTNFLIWCPLVEVGPDNGWLCMAAGTQRFNKGFRRSGMPYPELKTVIQERFLTCLGVRPGQVVFFHPRALHSSPANRTDELRVVVAGSIVPRACTRFHLCHPAPELGEHMLEVFEVDEELFHHHILGRRPVGARSHSVLAAPPEPLDIDLLTETCAALVRGPTDSAIVHGFRAHEVGQRHPSN